ncbi:glucose-6-phosphate isomerase [Candidatus Giovannonibacteria bacterium]|nr:glucose-6-phosphate isomerase [Candidatus Giovannonibacteria bacterium]
MNLSKRAGLDIALEKGELKLGPNIEAGEKTERTTAALGPVLYVPSGREPRVVYEVWRDLAEKEDVNIKNGLKIRYDVTAIFPKKIGQELPKTFGHYHPANGAGVGYPEVFEVLSGRAWFLIQRPQKNNPKTIEEAYLVEALEGEKVLIPPGFGFISVNPETTALVTANWVNSEFENDYEIFENLRGGAYYLLESADGTSVEFKKNAYYEKVPEIMKLRVREIPKFGLRRQVPLYQMIKEPANLEFLTRPEKYLEFLTIEKCFKKI